MVLPRDPEPADSACKEIGEWRPGDRVKTVTAALVLCMNIGVGPPDVQRPSNCAKLEVWLDPYSLPQSKAIETLGHVLQQQYEMWQPRAKYKLLLDPCVEDLKKMCLNLRRSAKEERILFHYNGHGVPKPTSAGEIWVFNKNFTQYIPVSIFDLQTWLGSPCILVYDCNAAGQIVNGFNQFAKQRDTETAHRLASLSFPYQKQASALHAFSDCFQLAACRATELLPWHPDLPADLFTACLTTPILMSFRWYVLQHPRHLIANTLMADNLPGKICDRRSPLGELNWIFTAITDTIAWSALPGPLFRQLYRQDLMVASLFRNFLLAQRILKSYHCQPISVPVLPETDQHPMWLAWDLVIDLCISQLDDMMNKQVPYIHSNFFSDQLASFEMWLSLYSGEKKAPETLPILLQVLLSQQHRLRALILLSRFLDLGAWAVYETLQVGIFPYILKLLHSPALELKPVLTFIWARLLAVDSSCQVDLVKENGFHYFLVILKCSTDITKDQQQKDLSEHRAMCAFILATVCYNFPLAQQLCFQNGIISICIPYLTDPDDLLRQWSCLCLSHVCDRYEPAIHMAFKEKVHTLINLEDPIPEVRAAGVFLLGVLMQTTEPLLQIELCTLLLPMLSDGSSLVRHEAIIAASSFIRQHPGVFRNSLVSLNANLSNGASVGNKSHHDDPMQMLLIAYAEWLVIFLVDPKQKISEVVESFLLNIISDNSPSTLRSELYDHCRTYYCEPQIQEREERRPGSRRAWEREWIFERNKSIVESSLLLLPDRKFNQWRQSGLLQHSNTITALRFHAFEPFFFVGDSKGILFYDSESYQPLDRFETENFGAVSSLEMIQEDSYGLLAASTRDGVVLLYRDLTTTPSLLNSWRGLTDLKQSGPTRLKWIPTQSCLAVAGDTRIVKLWNLETELLAHQLHTCCASAVSGLTNYQQLVVLGCYDGSIRVLDTRLPPFRSLVHVFKEHRGYVIQCDMQPDRPGSLVSASPSEIKYWDLRKSKSIRTTEVYTNASLSSLHIHPNAPLVVCGSAASQFKLFQSTTGNLLLHLTHYQGFLAQRLGKVIETPFHPYSAMFAVGCSNGVVSFYESED